VTAVAYTVVIMPASWHDNSSMVCGNLR